MLLLDWPGTGSIVIVTSCGDDGSRGGRWLWLASIPCWDDSSGWPVPPVGMTQIPVGALPLDVRG